MKIGTILHFIKNSINKSQKHLNKFIFKILQLGLIIAIKYLYIPLN